MDESKRLINHLDWYDLRHDLVPHSVPTVETGLKLWIDWLSERTEDYRFTLMHPMLPRLPEARHGISISAATFSIVMAPIIEEYLMRVKLLPFLIRRTNLPAAVFFSSFIFSVLNGQVFLLPYFLNSLVYSWVALKTKKAYGSMIVHSSYNFIALIPGA